MSSRWLTYTALLCAVVICVTSETPTVTATTVTHSESTTSTPTLVTQQDGSGEESDIEEDVYCPGYKTGRPSPAELENCTMGAGIGVVDHLQAFGINHSNAARTDWTACNIPFLPGEKYANNERVCYKTTVLSCQDSYRIYLNRRNLQTLQSSCPNESDKVPVCTQGGLFLQSPRYGCTNPNQVGRGNLFKYRKSEFCLYNISVPDCESGEVVIDNTLHFTQEIESRQRNRICSDYLQIFTSESSSERFCDSELARLVLRVPTTNFTAIFWTDTSANKLGFKLRITCAINNT